MTQKRLRTAISNSINKKISTFAQWNIKTIIVIPIFVQSMSPELATRFPDLSLLGKDCVIVIDKRVNLRVTYTHYLYLHVSFVPITCTYHHRGDRLLYN